MTYEPSDENYVDHWEQTRGLCERCERRRGEEAKHGEWLCVVCSDLEDEVLGEEAA